MKLKVKNPDPVIPNAALEAKAENMAEQQVADRAKAQQMALVKQDALPALEVVKNRDGSDRLAARQKGKFTKTANARVLATQKSIEKILHLPDDSGKTQLEKIITTQAKVAEENTDARNLGAVTKFIEITDEISGSKAAREALTREINTPIVPTVIIIPAMDLMHPEIIDEEKRQREAAQRNRKGPSFLDAELVQQNSPKGQDKC